MGWNHQLAIVRPPVIGVDWYQPLRDITGSRARAFRSRPAKSWESWSNLNSMILGKVYGKLNIDTKQIYTHCFLDPKKHEHMQVLSYIMRYMIYEL